MVRGSQFSRGCSKSKFGGNFRQNRSRRMDHSKFLFFFKSLPKMILLTSLIVFIAGAAESAHLTQEEFQLRSVQTCLSLDASHRYIYTHEELHTLQGHSGDAICEWKGLFCTNGVLRRLILNSALDFLRVKTDWLPSTLEHIEIFQIPLRQQLHTRRLPRRLRRCSMDTCELTGPIDLQGLPRGMESLNLNNNAIDGVVIVANLPETMQRLFLAKNAIRKVYVQNAGVPKNLEYVLVHRSDEKPLKIRCIDGDVPDVRVRNAYDVGLLLDIMGRQK